MEDDTSMSGATHEEALKKESGDTDKKVQKKEEIKVSVPVDEESIVWDGKTEIMHPMDNGSDMSWTEEEMKANEEVIHPMNDGSKMEWTEESMSWNSMK